MRMCLELCTKSRLDFALEEDAKFHVGLPNTIIPGCAARNQREARRPGLRLKERPLSVEEEAVLSITNQDASVSRARQQEEADQ